MTLKHFTVHRQGSRWWVEFSAHPGAPVLTCFLSTYQDCQALADYLGVAVTHQPASKPYTKMSSL